MNVEIDIMETVLETPRLYIRAWKQSDLDDFYEYASVEGVGEMAGWVHHQSKEESQSILHSFIEQKHTFAIVHKQDQKVIGSIGVDNYDETLVDAQFEPLACKEIGYVLSKDYWGLGYMSEAVQEVMCYCFDSLHLDALFCSHYIRNPRSKRVVEKCKFQFYKDVQLKTRYDTVEDAKLYVAFKKVCD